MIVLDKSRTAITDEPSYCCLWIVKSMQSFDEQFVEALEEQFSLNVANLVAWVPT